ncbi:MAG: hypothetical protein JO023_24970 [Chloroflexi bacterium]|nr:hypothetical protein [Chloroflexota bacterium]
MAVLRQQEIQVADQRVGQRQALLASEEACQRWMAGMSMVAHRRARRRSTRKTVPRQRPLGKDPAHVALPTGDGDVAGPAAGRHARVGSRRPRAR